MILKHTIRLPTDRVGALIGKNGMIKLKIEEECGIKLKIDSNTGDVEMMPGDDPDKADLATALRIVEAIGHGFSFERASRLLRAGVTLDVIDLREYSGRSRSDLERIKGRIIGQKGKARRIIEELTGAQISIYGRMVAIIGTAPQVKIAGEAVRMLASGRMHKTVYNILQRERTMARFEKLRLWKKPGEEV